MFRVILVLLAVAMAGEQLLGQRSDLPSPNASRAPVLTTMVPDSIRYSTALLHLAELVQALQAGDTTTISYQLRESNLAPRTCEVGEAVSEARRQLRKVALTTGGTSSTLFFQNVAVKDSGAAQVVTADLVAIHQAAGVLTRTSVRLVLDAVRAVWTEESELINALCAL